MGEKWLGRCAMPIVFGIAKTMQRRGEYVVKSVEITRCQERVPVKKTRVLFPFTQCLGDHGSQEHAGVNLAIEAAAYGVATGRQVQGREQIAATAFT